MASLGEIVSDTVGRSAAIQGVADVDAGRIFFQDKRLGRVFAGTLEGAMQVMLPNFFYDVTFREHGNLRRDAVHLLTDAATTVSAVALATAGGQPEIAVAAKVVYNAASSKINRDRAPKPATSQA
jgi:uncharacterized protein (DUF2236 family)